MRVLELLEEIEEIVDTAAGFPLTGKIMVDSQELLEIVREIRADFDGDIITDTSPVNVRTICKSVCIIAAR